MEASLEIWSESLQKTEIGCYVAYGVAMAAVLLRLYAQAVEVRSMGMDDMLIIGGALSSTAIIVTVPYMYDLGIGRHMKTLTNHEILYGRQAAWISQIFYYFALSFIKCSIAALYRRHVSDPLHRKVLYILSALIMLHGITVSVVTSHMCSPVSIIWSNTFPTGCINLFKFNYFNTTFHILTEIILAVLPIHILVKLHLSRSRKIALATMFGAGILTIAATIARQVYNFIALASSDFSWDWASTELATNIEINMGIICACVPAIQSLFKTWFGNPSASNPSNGSSAANPGSKWGFKWHSSGRSSSASVREINRRENVGGEGSEDMVIIHGTDNFRPPETNPWVAISSLKGTQQTAVTRGERATEENLPLTGMGGRSKTRVPKKVDYRVDYSTQRDLWD